MRHSPICPYCDGPIGDHTEGHPGGMNVYYRCNGFCGRLFYPPWPEHCWEDPSTRPVPTELASWYDAPAVKRITATDPTVVSPLAQSAPELAPPGVPPAELED